MFSEEPNVPWPTCIDSKKKLLKVVFRKIEMIYFLASTCPNPTNLSTAEIVLANAINNDLDYTNTYKYELRKKVISLSIFNYNFQLEMC